MSSKDVKKQVMETIKKNEVTMHSHAYFVALNAIVLMASLSLALLCVVLVNTLVYDVQTKNAAGFGQFVGRPIPEPGFPWLLLVLTLALVTLAVYIIRRFRFAYRQKNITLAVAAVGVVLAFGIVLAQSEFGRSIAGIGPLRPLRPTSRFLEKYSVVGTISQIDENSLTIQNNRGKKITFSLNNLENEFNVGDRVIIVVDPDEANEVLAIRLFERGSRLENLPLRERFEIFEEE